jgi:hypothetical protein
VIYAQNSTVKSPVPNCKAALFAILSLVFPVPEFKFFQVLPNLGLAVQIGRFNQGDWDLDENAMLDLIENQSRHSAMRERMKGMFDLNSTSRIVDEISKL